MTAASLTILLVDVVVSLAALEVAVSNSIAENGNSEQFLFLLQLREVSPTRQST